MMWTDNILGSLLDREPAGGRLRDHKGSLSLIQRIADAVIVMSALWLSCKLTGADWSPSMSFAAALGALLFYVLAEAKNVYRPWRTGSVKTEVWYAVEAWLGVAGISLVAVYAQQDAVRYPPDTMLMWFLGAPVLLGLWRIGVRISLRWARAHGFNTRTLAIAGSGDLARHVARTVARNPWMGFRVVGLFDDAGRDAGSSTSQGSLDALIDRARAGDLDVVYIAFPPGQAERQAQELVRKLSDSTASVYLVQDRRSRSAVGEQSSRQILPDLWRVDVLQRRRVDLAGINAVSVYESPFLGLGGWIKRIEDIAISGVALLLLAVPMTAIAIGVKRSSPGPVFFKQRRYGLDGREIMVWKFRSMTVCEDGDTVTQAQKEDARVTRFGAFLRRTSLDELPQLINVFLGSMSIVGPRPHAVSHNEHYRSLIGGYMLRHKVKPGITGWAQINGWRGETDSLDKMGRRVDFDLEYIRNWSIWLDMQIVLLTFVRGFIHKNAY